MSNAIVLNSTFVVPVFKLNNEGKPVPKGLEYEIKTQLGSNSSVIKVSLSEFSKNGKDGNVFINFELDHSLNFIYTAFAVKNSKNFLTSDGNMIANLTEVVLKHFLSINLITLPTDNIDKTWLLLHQVIPILKSEEIGSLSNLKIGVKRKIKSIEENELLTVWASLGSYNDPILKTYIDYAKGKVNVPIVVNNKR